MVETDHKPLEMISMKNPIAAPFRLQRMLLWLQQYDMTIMYRPDKEMLLADALSCLPSWTDTQIKLDLRVDAISISAFTRSHLTKNLFFQDNFTQWILDSFWDPCITLMVFLFSMGNFLEKINSFRTILHSEFQIHFKTPVTYTPHSVNGLLSGPFGRGKEHRAHSNTVLVPFWTPSRPHIRNQRRQRTQDNPTDHSSSSSSHHRGNIIVPNNHSSDI